MRKLAKSCNFGVQEDSIICDQLVRGMLRDDKLKDKLYEEDYLNLEKAIKIITTHEIRATPALQAWMPYTIKVVGRSPPTLNPFNNWGQVVHNFNVCPTAKVTCFHCKEKGHYARKCKSHNTHEVEVEEVEEMYDHFYIETISLNPPNVDSHVNNIKSCEQQKEKREPLSVKVEKDFV